MEILANLFYNLIMKKIVITILIAMSVNTCVYAYPWDKKTEPVQTDNITEQVKVLYAQNNIDKALEMLQNKPEADRSALDWLLIGNILQDKDKINEAVYMFNQAINKDPKYYQAHYNLGYIYLIQEKPNMALTEFKKAVKYKPDFSYGYYNMGCAYLKLKDWRNARYNFFRAMDIKNSDPNIYYNLAYCFKMLNKEKQAQAYLDIYNKMTERQ